MKMTPDGTVREKGDLLKFMYLNRCCPLCGVDFSKEDVTKIISCHLLAELEHQPLKVTFQACHDHYEEAKKVPVKPAGETEMGCVGYWEMKFGLMLDVWFLDSDVNKDGRKVAHKLVVIV